MGIAHANTASLRCAVYCSAQLEGCGAGHALIRLNQNHCGGTNVMRYRLRIKGQLFEIYDHCLYKVEFLGCINALMRFLPTWAGINNCELSALKSEQ